MKTLNTRTVARQISRALDRQDVSYSPRTATTDGDVDISNGLSVQVGKDYLIVCFWENHETLATLPARKTIAEIVADLRKLLTEMN